MQHPTPKTPVSKCNELGLYCCTMLGKFKSNLVLMALATTLSEATTTLDNAQKAYAAAVIALIPKRVSVKYADFVSDKAVRMLQLRAELADGKKGGKISTAILPNGTTPIVRPVGKTQVHEMRALEGRLEAAIPIWPAAAQEKALIVAERIAYETALEERSAAMQFSADLRAKRDAAKEDFLDIYATTAAKVRAEFPRDRTMQDLFFDRVSDGVSAHDDEGDDDEGAGAPAAGGTPGGPGGTSGAPT